MYSIVLPNGTALTVQNVYQIILMMFCVLATLSWWVARKDWDTEEATGVENHKEHENEPQKSAD